jgi:putative DNA primase/helicase
MVARSTKGQRSFEPQGLCPTAYLYIYQRDAVMMRPGHGIKRATVVRRLMPVKPLYLIEMLGRVASFQSYDRRRRDWIDKDCPSVMGETLLAREGVWRVPVLLGVVRAPQLRADGSLLTVPGYDPQTQLLYKPDGEHFPDISDRPGKDDGQRALEMVKQSILTFPFGTEADRAVALALFLTGVCRRTLDFAPLFAITAPAHGAGAVGRDRRRRIREAVRRCADGRRHGDLRSTTAPDRWITRCCAKPDADKTQPANPRLFPEPRRPGE